MKDVLIVGDTLDFGTVVPGYLATDGYTLVYRLIPRVSGAAITITALADGDNYRVAEPPATTALWTAGEYSWSAWVEKTGERYSVDSGTVTLKEDPAVVAAYDGRSFARKMVDGLEAALLAYSSSGGHVAEYEIAGRRMKYASKAEIVSDLSHWKATVWREDAAAKMAAGMPNPRQIRVRMARA